MRASEIKKEQDREDREAGMEKLIHLSYDRLADGGRGLANRIARKVVDPEAAEVIRKIWGR